MIIPKICKIIDCSIKFLVRMEIVKIDHLVFQSIVVTFHRSVIVRVSGLTHALRNMDRLAEFDKFI